MLKHNKEKGNLKIIRDGKVKKLVRQVYKSFFSGEQALRFGKEVLYVTERAVIMLPPTGLILTEVAPSVVIHRDIVSRMERRPEDAGELKEMGQALFRPKATQVAARARRA